MGRETVIYNGKKYHRYPESKHAHLRNYFYRHDKNNESPVSLHRQIWEDNNGPIPEGMEIHHRDHNPSNNSIENFECLTTKEHRKQHPISEQGRASINEAAKRNNSLAKWREREPEAAYAVCVQNGKENKALENWKKDNPELAKETYREAGKKGGSVGAGAKALDEWRKNNPEAAKAISRENGNRSKEALQNWHSNNPGKATSRLQEWRKNNPELAREAYILAGKKSAEARRAKKAAGL